jgi:SWIM zinc finger
MAEPILADNRHITTTREAILQRTTCGMLTYNTGKVHHLEGELWAVPSTRGGFHKVDLGVEACDCEDWTFYGSAAGIGCRHIYAAAIARASRRSGIGVRIVSVAGDPFKAAARRRGCSLCFGGYITMTAEEDGEEVIEAVPCRRCQRSSESL